MGFAEKHHTYQCLDYSKPRKNPSTDAKSSKLPADISTIPEEFLSHPRKASRLKQILITPTNFSSQPTKATTHNKTNDTPETPRKKPTRRGQRKKQNKSFLQTPSVPTIEAHESCTTDGRIPVEMLIFKMWSISSNHTAETANRDLEVKAQAADQIKQEAGDAQFTSSGNGLVFTTPGGSQMLQQVLQAMIQENNRVLDDKLKRHDEELSCVKSRLEKHDQELNRVTSLLKTFEPYSLDVRNRWMSANRTRLNNHNENPEDKTIREKVNTEIHSADAYVDALLYKEKKRIDEETYTGTYGIEWGDVYYLGQDFCGLRAINRQGTLNYLERSGDKRDRERHEKLKNPYFENGYSSFLQHTTNLVAMMRKGSEDKSGIQVAENYIKEFVSSLGSEPETSLD